MINEGGSFRSSKHSPVTKESQRAEPASRQSRRAWWSNRRLGQPAPAGQARPSGRLRATWRRRPAVHRDSPGGIAAQPQNQEAGDEGALAGNRENARRWSVLRSGLNPAAVRWPRNYPARAFQTGGASPRHRLRAPSTTVGSVTRQAGKPVATMELSAPGARTRRCPQSPRRCGRPPPWRATASSSSHGLKKNEPAKRRRSPEEAAQAATTATRSQRRRSGGQIAGEEDGHRRLQHHQPAPGKLQKAQLGQQIPDGQRDGKLQQRIATGISASGIHQRRVLREAAPPPRAPAHQSTRARQAAMRSCERR
jgi:hypothetical protein